MKGKEVLELLSKDVKVSIHSDDPAYFGGYISDNYSAIASNFKLTKEQVIQLAKIHLKLLGLAISKRNFTLKN